MGRVHIPSESEIHAWMARVPIATKDYGVAPIHPWGTQRYLIQRILKGIDKGIHQYLVVKCRQAGVSTYVMLLTLLWMSRFPGLQGLTVTDSQENKEYFRDLFLSMVETLGTQEGANGDGPMLTDPTNDPAKLRTRNLVQI